MNGLLAVWMQVPPALDQIILKLLEREVEQRMQTAAELLVALDGVALSVSRTP